MGLKSLNNPNSEFKDPYAKTEDSAYWVASPMAIQATGGFVNDYAASPTVTYRAHVFYESGTFDVTSLSVLPSIPDTIEYFVLGGGGGGGSRFGGG